MMREILFRGKRTDGEWVEGYLCKKYFQEVPRDRYAIMYKTEYDAKRWQPDYMTAEVDPETVGQYTGLTDKNGKKIFEGDVVKLDVSVKEIFSDVEDGEIVYRRGGFYVGDVASCLSSLDVIANCSGVFRGEIIGNIHDNPECWR